MSFLCQSVVHGVDWKWKQKNNAKFNKRKLLFFFFKVETKKKKEKKEGTKISVQFWHETIHSYQPSVNVKIQRQFD